MFRKILVGLDGSQGSWRAFRAGLALAQEQRAALWVLSVEDRLPHFAATVGEMEEEKAFANHYYGRLQEEARGAASQVGVRRMSLRDTRPKRWYVMPNKGASTCWSSDTAGTRLSGRISWVRPPRR